MLDATVCPIVYKVVRTQEEHGEGAPFTHLHSSWEKHREQEWELVTEVGRNKKREWLRGSEALGAVLSEAVTSSLRFRDVEKTTGSYQSKGEPWRLK